MWLEVVESANRKNVTYFKNPRPEVEDKYLAAEVEI